jgi:hypothetical protein
VWARHVGRRVDCAVAERKFVVQVVEVHLYILAARQTTIVVVINFSVRYSKTLTARASRRLVACSSFSA